MKAPLDPPRSIRTLLGALCLDLAVSLTTVHAATLSSGYTIGSGLLAPSGQTLFLDNAATGGGDSANDGGVLSWAAVATGLWSPGDNVSLSGIALPIWSSATATANTTLNGTFTFSFYDLGANNDFDGSASDTLVGSATANFTQGAIGAYYVNFDTPVSFTSFGNGVAVNIGNSAAIRLKINTAGSAPGVVRELLSNGTAAGGANPNFRMSLAGSIVVVPEPSVLALSVAGLFGLLLFRRR